jgi:hypothetical protein
VVGGKFAEVWDLIDTQAILKQIMWYRWTKVCRH